MATGLSHYSTARIIFVTKECGKSNALLSSVIPHARTLTKFVNINEDFKNYQNFVKGLRKKVLYYGWATFLIGLEPFFFCFWQAGAFRTSDLPDSVSG